MDPDVQMFAHVMTVIVMSFAGLVSIALGAWTVLRRVSATKPRSEPPHDEAHLRRLETAVDTIAIEVERISEAQRFMVSLLAESLPARRAEHAGELAAPERAGRVNTPR
jgi:hypothetical protein